MNKEKTIKFLWISMWATLLLMVVLKLTFNYYYPIVIENSKLLEISYFIDNTCLYYIFNYLLYIINSTLIYLCSVKEKWFRNKWHLIIVLSAYTLAFPFKILNPWIGFVAILIPYLIIPLFTTHNKRYWIFVMFILDNLFQILTNYARDNSLIAEGTFLVVTFLWLDYYLLFVIYYIGGCHMGLGGVLPWFAKKETVIDSKIEKLQKKIKKLEEQKSCLKRR